MTQLLDMAALLVVLSLASFSVSGVFALPLLRDLATRHGIPRSATLVVLIPLVGLPAFFVRLLRAGAGG